MGKIVALFLILLAVLGVCHTALGDKGDVSIKAATLDASKTVASELRGGV
jgi:hypothetical protein